MLHSQKYGAKSLLCSLCVVSIFLATNVFAVGDEKYAKLVENTYTCAPNSCYTIYEYIANGTTLHLKNTDLLFKFRKGDKTGSLTIPEFYSDLKSYSLWINETETYVCSGNAGNNTQLCRRDVYRPLQPFDKVLQQGERAKIMLKGSIKPGTSVDNVVQLWVGDHYETYDQWINWTADDTSFYYQFNQTYIDGSGNNNLLIEGGSGAVFNTTDYKVGNASWQGAGAAQAINNTAQGLPLGTGPWTLSVWVNPSAQPETGGENRIFSFGLDNCATLFQNFALVYADTGGTKQVRATSCGTTVNTAYTMTTGSWYYLVFTYNGTGRNYSLYINNVSESTGLFGGTDLDICGGSTSAACDIAFGTFAWSVAEQWIGRIDDFRLHDFVLNYSERSNAYNYTYGNGGSNLTVAVTAPPSASPENVLNVTTGLQNFTIAYESNTTFYYLNISINNTNITIAHVNASIQINGTYFNTTGRERINNTFWTFNYSRSQPIVAVNNSNFAIRWNWTAAFNNSQFSIQNLTNNTNGTIATNQSVFWSFFISNVTISPEETIEGESVVINWNFTSLNSILYNFTRANALYDGGNQTNISLNVNNSNITLQFRFTNITRLLSSDATVTNRTNNFTMNVTFTYNGEEITRNASNNHRVNKMLVTNCSGNSASTTVALSYELFDEDLPTIRRSVDAEDGYVLYSSDIGINRTFGFSRTGRNNWTTCLYPTSNNLNLKYSIIYGNDTVKRTVRTLFFIANSTQRNVSLYVLNTTPSNSLNTVFRINNLAGLGQTSRQVDVYRYYISDDIKRLIFSEVTDSNGEFQSWVRTEHPEYTINVSKENNASSLDKKFGPMKIFATPITLVVGLAQVPGWNVIVALRKIKHDLTFNNVSKTFLLSWDYSALTQEGFTIDNLCLELNRKQNSTLEGEVAQNQCSTASTGSLTSNAINYTNASRWWARAYVNITSSPLQLYTLETLNAPLQNTNILGVDALLWGALVLITVFFAGSWNPVVGVVMAMIAAGVMIAGGVISIGGTVAIGSIAVIAGIIVYNLRT